MESQYLSSSIVSYNTTRHIILTKLQFINDYRYVRDHKWESNLKAQGVAGIRNFDSVKCLHAHLAHYLARPSDGNVVGHWVDRLLAEGADLGEREENLAKPDVNGLGKGLGKLGGIFNGEKTCEVTDVCSIS